VDELSYKEKKKRRVQASGDKKEKSNPELPGGKKFFRQHQRKRGQEIGRLDRLDLPDFRPAMKNLENLKSKAVGLLFSVPEKS